MMGRAVSVPVIIVDSLMMIHHHHHHYHLATFERASHSEDHQRIMKIIKMMGSYTTYLANLPLQPHAHTEASPKIARPDPTDH